MPLTLIADDLTGACDAGCVFAGRGRVGVFVAPAAPDASWDVAAVDTETRALAPPEAARRLRAAVERSRARLRAGRLFKKIDSTMRGAVGAELDALLAAAGLPQALVCPAFPDQHRTVVHAILRVNGLPAHESPVGRDPAYPGRTSDLLEILAAQSARPLVHLPLKEVRGAAAECLRRLDEAGAAVVVADAETASDLDALARLAVARPSTLLAGSAGLAEALAAALGHAPRAPVPLPAGRALLVVAGSLHPATRAQLGQLLARGVAAAWLDPAGPGGTGRVIAALRAGAPALLATREPEAGAPAQPRQEAARALARMAARVLRRARPDLVAVTGGETALALFEALGAARLELLGAPSSGLALGELVGDAAAGDTPAGLPLLTRPGGFGPPLPLLTKAGGFGPPDLFTRFLERN